MLSLYCIIFLIKTTYYVEENKLLIHRSFAFVISTFIWILIRVISYFILDNPHILITSSIIICVLQITSSLTGSIIVEDVVYENVDSEVSCIFPSRELMFRRLVFERAANLVQSEALLRDELLPTKLVGETETKKVNSSSKSKKSGSQRQIDGIVEFTVQC